MCINKMIMKHGGIRQITLLINQYLHWKSDESDINNTIYKM